MDLSEVSNNKNRHPWELSRTHCILRLLHQIGIKGRVLDIGCGDAYFDYALLEKEKAIQELWGVDINLPMNTDNGNIHLVRSVEQIGPNQFDFILLMDVLEHVDKDYEFLLSIKKRLSPLGIAIITVPAYQWLFSVHDIELHHFRRYNYKQLKNIIHKSEFQIKHWSYFYTTLIIMRLMTIKKSVNLGIWNYSQNHILTKLLISILDIDFAINMFLSKMGIHFGGLSLMIIVSQENEN